MLQANTRKLFFSCFVAISSILLFSCADDTAESTLVSENVSSITDTKLPPGQFIIDDREGYTNVSSDPVTPLGNIKTTVTPDNEMSKPDREAFLKKKFKSLLMFHADDTMTVDQPRLATLVLAKNNSLLNIKKEVLDEADVDDKETSDTAMEIGSKMKARLIPFDNSSDKGVEIEALGEAEQSFTTSRDKIIWQWKVTPKKKGQQILKLSVQIVEKDGEVVNLPAKDITVNIFAKKESYWAMVSDFLERKWEFLITALMVPILIAYFTTRMKNKSTQSPAPPPPSPGDASSETETKRRKRKK